MKYRICRYEFYDKKGFIVQKRILFRWCTITRWTSGDPVFFYNLIDAQKYIKDVKPLIIPVDQWLEQEEERSKNVQKRKKVGRKIASNKI